MRATWRRAAFAAIVATGAAAAPPDRLLEGELVRVDLERGLLVVRPSGGPPREVDVTVDRGTAISASGRAIAIEELKPVERVAVLCDGALPRSCRARRVRSGPLRRAVGPAAPQDSR